MTSPLDTLLDSVKSQKALADLIGVSPQAIQKWKKQIPAERVLQIERATGVSRHDLRPDLYPRESKAPEARATA